MEHSVYVRNDQRGNGLGPRLMEALVVRAREAGNMQCGRHRERQRGIDPPA